MSVPKEAASTTAKVTVSFSAWKEAHIAPATFEVPIQDVSPEEEATEEREAKERAEASRRALEEWVARIEKQVQGEKDPKKQEQGREVIRRMKEQLQGIEKP